MSATPHRFVYFHGLPGYPDEFRLFAPQALLASTITPDRLKSPGASYEQSLLASFDEATEEATQPLTLLGFSLGTMAALRIAARRPRKVDRILLATPAAPLESGNFVPAMAGRPVCKAAQRGD